MPVRMIDACIPDYEIDRKDQEQFQSSINDLMEMSKDCQQESLIDHLCEVAAIFWIQYQPLRCYYIVLQSSYNSGDHREGIMRAINGSISGVIIDGGCWWTIILNKRKDG